MPSCSAYSAASPILWPCSPAALSPARSANHPDHHDGMLHGLGVWALSFVVAFAILGSGASKTGGAPPSVRKPAGRPPVRR